MKDCLYDTIAAAAERVRRELANGRGGDPRDLRIVLGPQTRGVEMPHNIEDVRKYFSSRLHRDS